MNDTDDQETERPLARQDSEPPDESTVVRDVKPKALFAEVDRKEKVITPVASPVDLTPEILAQARESHRPPSGDVATKPPAPTPKSPGRADTSDGAIWAVIGLVVALATLGIFAGVYVLLGGSF